MTERSDLAQCVARANPVDDPQDIADSLGLHHELLAVIDARSNDAPSLIPTRRLDAREGIERPVIAFGAALAALLVVIGTATLLFSGPIQTNQPADDVVVTSSTQTTTANVDETGVAETVTGTESQLTWRTVDQVRWAPPGAVAYANGRFAAVGNGIWYSDDLETWTPIPWTSVMSLDDSIEGYQEPIEVSTMAAGPLGFVVGGSGLNNRGYTPVLHSEDGVTWTRTGIQEPEAWDVQNMFDITAGGPGWVAIGAVGRDGRIWVSGDGLVWDTIALPEFEGVWFVDVMVNDGQMTAIGKPAGWSANEPQGKPGVEITTLNWTSNDGLTWQPLPLQQQAINPTTHEISINPDTGQRIALNVEGVWISDDGVEWQEVNRDNGVPPFTHPTHGTVWLGDTILGVHRQTNALFESSDGGETWIRSQPFAPEDENAWPQRLFIHDGQVIATIGGLWIGTPE